ncbi:MAG: flagellar basal body-associated FliL family protein [Spirochaetales bacterium]|nr:flagellar basal body-associated FliL family protein [Spirochaetales bacterium]
MGDEELDLSQVDVQDGDITGEKKKKGLSEGLARILIWVVGILVGLIVTVTVSVVTYKIMDRNSVSRNFPAVSQEYETKPEVYIYFGLINEIRTTTNDPTRSSIIVKVLLGYDSDKDNTVGAELTSKVAPLTDMIRNYFSKKTVGELKPDQEQILKEELKSMVNGILSTGVIKDVVFEEFQIIEG